MVNKSVKITAIVLALFLILGLIFFICLQGEKTEEVILVKQGSSGQTVKQIQTKLNSLGYWCGTVDGIYGTKTKNAVIQFQRAKGIGVDGIVGNQTANLLGISTSTSQGTSTGGGGTASNNDLYMLAKAIYAEARGEPYTGKVAVGAVILNRVKSPKFPNTVSGVIYQKGAFTAVSDGQINLAPNQECMRAAQDALNGWDPSYGCLYYYNPAKATSAWIWNTKTVTVIGQHVFSI